MTWSVIAVQEGRNKCWVQVAGINRLLKKKIKIEEMMNRLTAATFR